MKRNYKIIENHLYWGYDNGDSSVGHAIVAGRLAGMAVDVSWRTTSIFDSYQEYLTECKRFGIYSCIEELFNQFVNPQ